MKTIFTADQISQIRKFTGFTQREFGARVGVSQRQVSAWEKGDALIGIRQARRIVAEFALSSESFDFPFPPENAEGAGADFCDFTTGDDVRAFRIDRGLSQDEFAKQVGVTSVTVSSWERKGARPLPATASDKIAVGFGLGPQPQRQTVPADYRERVARLQRQIDKIPPENLDALEPIIFGLTREVIAKNDVDAN